MPFILIAIQVPFDPRNHARVVEGRCVPPHRYRITDHCFQCGNIVERKVAQQQPLSFQHYSFVHNSDRGSSGFSFCSSCQSSRALRSRVSLTTISTSTISSPRSPSRVADGTPFSLSRSFCPLCVPGGTRNCERPSIVGTSILAPRAASHATTGTVT